MAKKTRQTGSGSVGFVADGSGDITSTPRTPQKNSYFDSVDMGRSVKIPTGPEVDLLSNDLPSEELMVDLLFEDIGGQEILTVSRHDIVNGQDIIYQPIKNISKLANQYNSLNILNVFKTALKLFDDYKIDLYDYLPNEGNGPNGEYVYLDDDGNVIIEVVNISGTEEVEAELVSNIEVFNDINYGDES